MKKIFFLIIFGTFFQTVVTAQTASPTTKVSLGTESSKLQTEFSKEWTILLKSLEEIVAINKQQKMTEIILTKAVCTPIETRYKQVIVEASNQAVKMKELFGEKLQEMYQEYYMYNPAGCIAGCGLGYLFCARVGCDPMCQFLCAQAYNGCVAGCYIGE